MIPSPNVSQLLDEIRRLMELKGENPFKIRAFEKASHALAGMTDLKERALAGTLTELEGVGKGISEILTEFLLHGTCKMRDELTASIPPGLLQLVEVPGLGPKKAKQLIEELKIQSLVELEYACRENRLLKLKGFGEKIQKKVLDGIQFLNTNQGQQRISDALPIAKELLKHLHSIAPSSRISETGALRRRINTLSELEFLIELPKSGKAAQELKTRFSKETQKLREKAHLPIQLYYAEGHHYGYELARTTGSTQHWKTLGSPSLFSAETEELFYAHLKSPWIPPEMRETGEEISLARKGKLQTILPVEGIQGIFHNHTTRSDGIASLEEMVVAAKKLGYRFIGISDHSQSAFYANGLKATDLKDQEHEIRKVQEKHPEIRIFWGIESDILADGSLDYEPSLLKKFDFVIASIHSRFKMEKEAMTDRILAAIRNPYTRFLGHPTGRLLLGRPAYEIHMEKIIAEAAQHDVAIEINANPARLDIDWSWGPQLRAHQSKVSVNPDAHEVEGLSDTQYGVTVARKALLPKSLVINAQSPVEVEKWLRRG